MSDSGGLPDLSGILSRVTENPQAMSMLASLLGGMGEKPPAEKEPPKASHEASVASDEKPIILPSPPRKGRKEEERRRLLIALKPFLSPERQRALDTLLPILEALSLLMPRKEPPCT